MTSSSPRGKPIAIRHQHPVIIQMEDCRDPWYHGMVVRIATQHWLSGRRGLNFDRLGLGLVIVSMCFSTVLGSFLLWLFNTTPSLMNLGRETIYSCVRADFFGRIIPEFFREGSRFRCSRVCHGTQYAYSGYESMYGST